MPLRAILGPTGQYSGFDTDASAIAWCQKHIGTHDRRFEFSHFDLHNTYYNPGGQIDPAAWRWPYPEASFDVACLVSVFTHLLPESLVRYVAELWRVLAPGGKFYATLFLVQSDSETRPMPNDIQLKRAGPSVWTAATSAPEGAVAYTEEFISDAMRSAGFFVIMARGYHDIACGEKASRAATRQPPTWREALEAVSYL
jgi:SAM-dependent methyltransferase